MEKESKTSKESAARSEFESREVARLTVTLEPDALRDVIGSGRLLELADRISREAAAQISAQIVDQVAVAATRAGGITTGVSARVRYIFEGGDFGTVPPRPRFGIGRIADITSPLRVVVNPRELGADIPQVRE